MPAIPNLSWQNVSYIFKKKYKCGIPKQIFWQTNCLKTLLWLHSVEAPNFAHFQPLGWRMKYVEEMGAARVVSAEISSGAEQLKRKLKIRELRLSSNSPLSPPAPSPSTSVLQPSSDLNSPHHSLRQRFKNRFLWTNNKERLRDPILWFLWNKYIEIHWNTPVNHSLYSL